MAEYDGRLADENTVLKIGRRAMLGPAVKFTGDITQAKVQEALAPRRALRVKGKEERG